MKDSSLNLTHSGLYLPYSVLSTLTYFHFPPTCTTFKMHLKHFLKCLCVILITIIIMKRNLLVLSLSAFTAYIWLGNASGPGAVQGQDRTGSPVSPGYCGVNGCHGGGNFSTDVELLILDANEDTITEYTPGEQYRLRISIAAEGAEGYGFQAVALDSANDGAGEFGDASSGTQITTISGRQYFEHSSRSSASTFEIDWTAPEAGSGNISFYAAANAANADFNNTGDDPDTTSLIVVESLSSNLNAQQAEQVELQVYPSFVQTEVWSKWSPQVKAEQLTISDLTGRIYRQEKIVNQSTAELNIPVYDLPGGIYFVRLLTNEGFQTQKFLKL